MAKGRDSYSPEDLKSCNNCHKSAEKKRSEGKWDGGQKIGYQVL